MSNFPYIRNIIPNTGNYALTGTLNETKIFSELIPANTLADKDLLIIALKMYQLSNTTGKAIYAYFNTTDTIGGVKILSYSSATASRYIEVGRVFNITTTTSQHISDPTIIYQNDLTGTLTGGYTNTTIDFGLDQYLIITGQMNTSGDTMTMNALTLDLIR